MEQRYLDYFAKNIKHLCIIQDVKQEALATLSKLTKSYLSKIESLTIGANDEVLLRIYKALHHNLIINENKLIKMDDELERFHHDLVFCNKKEAKKTFDKLVAEKEKYLYSPELIKYCLFMYQCINMMGDEKGLLKDLDNYLDKLSKMISFNNRELQIFYDCKGVYEEDRMRFIKAELYYGNAISQGNFPNVTSMVYYHQSKTLYYLNKTIDSFIANNKALEMFAEENNIIRNYYSQSHSAILYLRLKNYEKAKDIEYSLLNVSGLKQYKDKTLRNLSWCLINNGEYKSAIHVLLENNGIKHFTTTSYFYVAWSYYCLNDYQKALNYANKGLLEPMDDMVIHEQLKTIIDLIKINDRSIIKILIDRYNRLQDLVVNEDKAYFIKIIIEYTEKYHMYKIANQFYKVLINEG